VAAWALHRWQVQQIHVQLDGRVAWHLRGGSRSGLGIMNFIGFYEFHKHIRT